MSNYVSRGTETADIYEWVEGSGVVCFVNGDGQFCRISEANFNRRFKLAEEYPAESEVVAFSRFGNFHFGTYNAKSMKWIESETEEEFSDTHVDKWISLGGLL